LEKVDNLHLLMITSEWPTPAHPEWAPFLMEQMKRLLEQIGGKLFAFLLIRVEGTLRKSLTLQRRADFRQLAPRRRLTWVSHALNSHAPGYILPH